MRRTLAAHVDYIYTQKHKPWTSLYLCWVTNKLCLFFFFSNGERPCNKTSVVTNTSCSWQLIRKNNTFSVLFFAMGTSDQTGSSPPPTVQSFCRFSQIQEILFLYFPRKKMGSMIKLWFPFFFTQAIFYFNLIQLQRGGFKFGCRVESMYTITNLTKPGHDFLF